MAAPQVLINDAVRRQVLLEGVKASEAERFLSFLKQIDKELRLALTDDVTAYSRTRLNAQIAAISASVGDIMTKYVTSLDDTYQELAESEARLEATALNKTITEKGFEAAVPDSRQLIAAFKNDPLSIRGKGQGLTLEAFTKQFTDDQVNLISGRISQGFAEGQTTEQVLASLRGTKARNFADGVLADVDRNTRTMVRTALQNVSSAARQATWEQNSDIITGVEWVSTLDERTTSQCASLDGKIFPIDSGPRPPLHFNSCVEGTKITTKNGLINIEDVAIGDLVLTHSGKWMPVYAVMCKQFNGPARKLINNFGASVSLTNEHPILTHNRGWVEVGDLNVGDILFNDTKEFSVSWLESSPSFVDNAVLIDANNIVTEATNKFVSYPIGSYSISMSSSIKLNNKHSGDKEVGGICSYNKLVYKFNSIFSKKINEICLMKSRVFPKIIRDRFCNLLPNISIAGWIAFFHPFRMAIEKFFYGIWICFHPSLQRLIVNIFNIISNRCSSIFCFYSKILTSLSYCVIGKAKRSFNRSKAFAIYKVLISNYFSNKVICNLFGIRHFYASTLNNIVDYTYSGMVYNISVNCDETYIADSFVVHNCRSTTAPVLADDLQYLEKGATRPAKGDDGTEKVSAKTTYYEWLKGQPADFQDSVIGPTRGKLLRDGGLTAEKFAALQLNKNFKPITIAEMEKLAPEAFEKAGLAN